MQPLDGYKVPYSVAAAVIALAGTVLIGSCGRLQAVEKSTGQLQEWQRGREQIDAMRSSRVDDIAVDVQLIKDIVMRMDIEQKTARKLAVEKTQ